MSAQVTVKTHLHAV